jgi:hypothetical protein
LATTLLSALVSDWLIIAFLPAKTPALVWIVMFLAVPFVIALATSYFLIWRATRRLSERALSVFLAGALAFSAAYIVGHLYGYIFPPHMVGLS